MTGSMGRKTDGLWNLKCERVVILVNWVELVEGLYSLRLLCYIVGYSMNGE